MTCPVCNSTDLAERKKAGIVLDECTSCGGLWFDRDELERYRTQLASRTDRKASGLVLHEDVAKKPCPRCRVLTLRSGSTGRLDAYHCTNCRGFFLSAATVTSLGNLQTTGVLDRVDPDTGELIVELALELISGIVDL